MRTVNYLSHDEVSDFDRMYVCEVANVNEIGFRRLPLADVNSLLNMVEQNAAEDHYMRQFG